MSQRVLGLVVIPVVCVLASACGSRVEPMVVFRFPVPMECKTAVMQYLLDSNSPEALEAEFVSFDSKHAAAGYPNLGGYVEVRSTQLDARSIEAMVNRPISECYPDATVEIPLQYVNQLLLKNIERYRKQGVESIYLELTDDAIRLHLPNRAVQREMQSEPNLTLQPSPADAAERRR